MLYLFLAFLSSASISVLLRAFESRTRSNMALFAGNYACCVAISLLYLSGGTAGEGSAFAVWLGIVSGALFLLSFVLLKRSIRLNGVALSSTFMKMGVLVPTLMAVLCFHERMTAVKAAGFVLAVAAILLLQLDKGAAGQGKHMGLLLVLLLAGGFTDSLSNIFERLGGSRGKDVYLLMTFLTALALSVIFALRERKTAAWTDVLIGALVGVPNYYSTRFLLLALRELPAVVVYPVYSVSVLLLVTLAGLFLFKERLTKRKLLALGLIVPALTLLNL